MPDPNAPDILFYSNTTEPTEFEFNGETIVNFGEVVIVALPPVEPAP